MKQITFILASVFVVLSLNTFGQVVRGDGNLSTEVRDISGFSEIVAQGNFNLILTQGDKEGIKIEADKNVQDFFQTTLTGDVLYISMLADVRKSQALNVYVSLKNLTSISLLDDVKLSSESLIHFEDLYILSSGSSQLDLEMYASKLELELTDGTYCHLKGYAEKLTVNAHDEVEVDAFDLQSDYCDVLSTGLTEVFINAQKDLQLIVTGTSNLYYTGEPKVSKRVFSSSGFVVRRKGVLDSANK